MLKYKKKEIISYDQSSEELANFIDWLCSPVYTLQSEICDSIDFKYIRPEKIRPKSSK